MMPGSPTRSIHFWKPASSARGAFSAAVASDWACFSLSLTRT